MNEHFDDVWDYDDPAGSEDRFRALLAQAERGSARHAQLLAQTARAQGLQRRFAAAHATLDEADALLGDNMPRARAQALLERGRLHNSAGRWRRRRPPGWNTRPWTPPICWPSPRRRPSRWDGT